MKKNLLKTKLLLLYFGLSLYSITGCAKDMDCNIDTEHVHQYVNDEGLKKYISGEKEYVGDFYWTDKYTSNSTIINEVSKNNLCLASQNIDYINSIMSNYTKKREAWINSYVYGSYYGYGYHYDFNSGDYVFNYGLTTGYHWEYEWQDIPLDKYTENKVRDITYEFKFYKIDENGNLVSKNFKTFTIDDIEEGYNYFNEKDFVQKYTSDSYYLNKEEFNEKVLELD